MRKDQKRNSEEEEENLLEKDKKKKGRRKGGKKTKSFCSNWHKYNFIVLISATVWASLVFGFIYVLSWKMFYET